jgi:hypothetical protein
MSLSRTPRLLHQARWVGGLCGIVIGVFPARVTAQTKSPSAMLQAKLPPVLLQIRPKPGDTLQMRLNQEVVMTGTTKVGRQDSTMSVTTTTHVRARVIVERAEASWTSVLAITDSIDVTSRGGRARRGGEEARRTLEGKSLRMRISPEGNAEITENPDALSDDLQRIVAQMPATLPAYAVSVGQTWTQDIGVPLAGQGNRGAGVLHTTFRFDSLSREGRIAYISMNGRFNRDSSSQGDLPMGAKLTSVGILKGAMRVDRMRGWMTDSRATITVNSLLTPPPGAADKPMRFYMRIIQHMRAEDRP